MQKVMILGATGSVGSSALQILEEENNQNAFQVETLIAGSNIHKLVRQSLVHRPKNIGIANKDLYVELKNLLSDFNIDCNVVAGDDAILDIVKQRHDIVIAAISGIAGLLPIYHCLSYTKKIAIANKESIVCAGNIIISMAKVHNVEIIPIDSEHSAIFQIFNSSCINAKCNMEKIILTASGGPFLYTDVKKLQDVKPQDAVLHPNWKMGKKISVDSATLMNKGLEVIEAAFLFDIAPEKIDVLIHPESIIHGIVCYKDGSSIAQMSVPDMKTSISLALSYPDRLNWNAMTLDLASIGKLNFMSPDYKKFPLLQIAIEALHDGVVSCIILNAVNELAVSYFLDGRLKFLDIVSVIKDVLEDFTRPSTISSIEDILTLDRAARAHGMLLLERYT